MLKSEEIPLRRFTPRGMVRARGIKKKEKEGRRRQAPGTRHYFALRPSFLPSRARSCAPFRSERSERRNPHRSARQLRAHFLRNDTPKINY